MTKGKTKQTQWLKNLNAWANRHEWLLVLIAMMMFLRLPSLFEPFWYGDENIYLAIGQALRKGAVLYQSVTDYPNKPPLIYWFAATVKYVSAFRFLLLLWSIPGVIFFHQLVRKITGTVSTSFFATLGFVYLTSTPILEGTIANAEIFFIVPTLGALWLLYPDKDGHKQPMRIHFLAGVLAAVSLLFKIHVVLDVVFIGLFFYLFPFKLRPQSLVTMFLNKRAWSFVAGLVLPVVMVLVWLGLRGVRPANLVANAASSSSYTAVWNSQDWLAQTLGMGSLQARVVAFIILILVLFILRFRLDKPTLFVSVWLVCSLFASLLSARPYPHYLIQVVPPLVVGLSLLFSKRRLHNYVVILGLLLLVGAAFLRFDFYLWPVKPYYRNFISYVSGQIDTPEYYRKFDRRMPRNYALARVIKQYSGPSDQIYIWGTEPGVYVLADRLQTGPLVVSFHVDDLDYFAQTIEDINRDKPALIVAMESEWRDYPQLDEVLRQDYLLIETVGDPYLSDSENQDFKARVYRRMPNL